MYGKGKTLLPPPPYATQFPPPSTPGTSGAPGPSNLQYAGPPPTGQSYSFSSTTRSHVPVPTPPGGSHNYKYHTPPPPPPFRPVGTNPIGAVPIPIPPPPPPPSSPPPPVPPPPPSLQPVLVPPPKPSDEEAVPNELNDANVILGTEIEHVASDSDMDMEDDYDVPAYRKPSSNLLHGSQSGMNTSSPFTVDVTPSRLPPSPGPTECIINESNTTKSSEEILNLIPNSSPFACEDNADQVGPVSDKDNNLSNNYNNEIEKSREESKLKRARSSSPSLSHDERNPKQKKDYNVGPAPDPTHQAWPDQITNLPSFAYPNNTTVPPPYQSHSPLPFTSHAERWPRPSPLPAYTGTSTSSHFSTITTRYNPYASTFETVPSFSSNFGSAVTIPATGTAYDPLSDSIDPVPVPTPISVPEKKIDEIEEVVTPDAEPGVVENASPETGTGPGPETGTGKESRAMKMLKVALVEYVKEVLKPAWLQGNISKDAFKMIVKKTVEKVSDSVPVNHIPKTPSKVNQYVQASESKLAKLVLGYVDKYGKS